MANLMWNEAVVASVRPSLPLLVAVALLAGCTFPWSTHDNGNVGAAANDLISGSKYSKLLIELDYPSGAEPNADAVSTLKSTIQSISGKSSVEVSEDPSIPNDASKKYSYEEIAALEDAHRDHHTGGDTAVLYLIYVAGGSTGDSSAGQVLGAAYRGTSIVIFKGNIRSSTGGGPLSGKPPELDVERAVLIHEFGHAAGLVNLGAPMVHPHEDTTGDGTGKDGHDPAKHGHSTNKDSVMFWAVESTGGLSVLCSIGLQNCNIPYTYDADDKADLAALRG